jgi:hypothetical protein
VYCVAYRFTLLPSAVAFGARAAQADFIDIWSDFTEYFKTQCGALGSRLHIGDDGAFYAYAQWPDKTTFDAASDVPPTEEFTKLRVKWAELVAPSEVLFQGTVEMDMFS